MVRDPSLVLDGRRYPLRIGDVCKMTGATPQKLRHWEDAGLLRAHRINGQRLFLRGGLVRAMVLKGREQYEIAHLAALIDGRARLRTDRRDPLRQRIGFQGNRGRRVPPSGGVPASWSWARRSAPMGLRPTSRCIDPFELQKPNKQTLPSESSVQHVLPTDSGWLVTVGPRHRGGLIRDSKIAAVKYG